jgi:hypothetical protein
MRHIAIVLTALILSACGGSGGSDAGGGQQLSCATLAGSYSNDMSPGDTLTINSDCTFTDSICGYDASYTVPNTLDNGATVITVNNTNGTPACMSNTAHMCVVEFNGTQLGINCDSGAHLYLFTVQ